MRVDLPAIAPVTCHPKRVPSLIGQTISHYRVLQKLGGEGMGVVFR